MKKIKEVLNGIEEGIKGDWKVVDWGSRKKPYDDKKLTMSKIEGGTGRPYTDRGWKTYEIHWEHKLKFELGEHYIFPPMILVRAYKPKSLRDKVFDVVAFIPVKGSMMGRRKEKLLHKNMLKKDAIKEAKSYLLGETLRLARIHNRQVEIDKSVGIGSDDY